MPLEDLTGAKYIDALVSTNPVGATDLLAEADDHMRGIKNVLKMSFPNVNGPVNPTPTEFNILVGATITSTELNFLTGLTENVQAAIDALNDIGVGTNQSFADNIELRFGDGDDMRLLHDGVNSYIDIYTNDLFIREAGTTTKFLFDVTPGDFHADGDVIAFSTSVGSDPELKDNIKRLKDAGRQLRSIRGYTFDWKKNGEPSAGVLSTEVAKQFPHLVTRSKVGDKEHDVVNYNGLIPYLIEALNALTAQHNSLKRRVYAMQREMAEGDE